VGGIPIPSKGKSKPDSTKGQPLPNYRGTLKTMDTKIITLTLGDDRAMDFKRTAKTKFFKNGAEIKDPKFAAGDQLSIEGPDDGNGFMTAVNVYWEKAASATAATAKKKEDGAVDTWKDAPQSAGSSKPAENAPPRATEVTGPPAPKDADDPGPPTLQRGKPAEQGRLHVPDPPAEKPAQAQPPKPAETAVASTPPSLPRFDDDTIPPPVAQGDDLIRKATDAAFDFTAGLPNYVCKEMMARYQSDSKPPHWQPLDVISANVIYENGKEDYRNLAINGKPVTKKMDEMGGSWSTGEFGTILINLFSPETAADFHYKNMSRVAGVSAKLYDFNVTHEHSHWDVHVGGQTYSPAFRGSVWIDPQTSRVLRIEMQAYGFPSDFPTDHVESATDYQYIRLGDTKQYLLPVHSENLSCERGSQMCNRNAIDFRNYHKYEGASSIQYGDEKQ
jgi:hypothetical protein